MSTEEIKSTEAANLVVEESSATEPKPTFADASTEEYRVRNNDAIPTEKPLRLIKLYGGSLPQNLDDIEAALIEQDIGIFQRNHRLVRPLRDVVEVMDEETAEDVGLIELKPAGLVEPITRSAILAKWDYRAKKPRRINCPKDLAEDYLARGQWKVRRLAGIINAPTLRRDGSLLDQAGYDRKTGLLYVPQPGVVFPSPPDMSKKGMPEMAALEAIWTLDELIDGYPFVGLKEGDGHCPARSVALAALVTGVIRRSLPTAPAFGITSPMPGAGKGKLCSTVSLLAIGRKPSPLTIVKSEEETEKRLSGALIRGDQVICLDNITDPVGGAKLFSVLTEEIAALRRLGGSDITNHLTNALFLFNGKNLRFTAIDMARRVLMCSINPNCEHPERIKYDFDPVIRAQKDRGRYVMAALTIPLAYIAAGSPPQEKSGPLGSYNEWNRLVRDALIWANEADPCVTIDDSKANDPETERAIAVFHNWAAVIGTGPGARVTTQEIVDKAHQAATTAAIGASGKPELLQALHAVAAPYHRGGDDEVDARRLGTWLGQWQDQIADGWCVRKAPKVKGITTWFLDEPSDAQ
jgi:hypothetical protein